MKLITRDNALRRQQGFTLLEVLVVMSLLGILLTLITTAISGASRSVNQAQHFSAALDEVNGTHAFLEHALGQVLPLSYQASDPHHQALFDGEPQQLTFVAPLPVSLGGGLYVNHLYLRGQTLVVSFHAMADAGGAALAEPQVLLRQVQALQFAYRGVDPKGKKTAWLASWPWPSRLPQSVRISARLPAPTRWVTQIVTLKLDLAGGG